MSRYQVFDTFLDVVMVIDAEGKLYYGNNAAAILFEVSQRRLCSGRPLTNFVTLEGELLTAENLSLVGEEATPIKEIGFQLPSGGAGWGQVSVQKQPEHFFDDEDAASVGSRWLLYLRDVSLEKTLHDKYRAELDKKEAVINDLQIARAKLEEYSKNLEIKVAERTAEISEKNRLLATILDSLGQGILVFDKDGKCLPLASRICQRILERDPNGQQVEDVLALTPDDRASFANWREAVFSEMLGFDDLAPLAPSRYHHSAGLEVVLEYQPMRGDNGVFEGVVLVATDRTREVEAERKAEREKELVSRVTQVARHRDAFRLFIHESREVLLGLRNPESLDHEDIMRRLHTLKGSAASFALGTIERACHELEDALKSGEVDPAVMNQRLAVRSAEVSMILESDLRSIEEILGAVASESTSLEIDSATLTGWGESLMRAPTLEEAKKVGAEIVREAFERPLGPSVEHFETSLDDLASTLGKRVARFEIKGGETRGPIVELQPLLASLVHAVRNAVYHGLEEPQDRLKAGKSEEGHVRLIFDRQPLGNADELTIRIEDDGRGIDAVKLREKLCEKGLSSLAAGTDEEVLQSILKDDVSLAKSVDQIAGRGVGLAAVAVEAQRLGGMARVSSKFGSGMTLEIRVPIKTSVLSQQSQIAASLIKRGA